MKDIQLKLFTVIMHHVKQKLLCAKEHKNKEVRSCCMDSTISVHSELTWTHLEQWKGNQYISQNLKRKHNME